MKFELLNKKLFSNFTVQRIPVYELKFNENAINKRVIEVSENYTESYHQSPSEENFLKLKSGTTNQRSNQLSYIRHSVVAILTDFYQKVKKKHKASSFFSKFVL